MNCIQTRQLLDDFLDGDLAVDQAAALNAHLHQCENCRLLRDESLSLREALRELPVTPASDDFEQRVLAAATRQQDSSTSNSGVPRNRHFAAGFVTAMAASLALWFASGLFIPEQPAPSSQSISLTVAQSRTVNLVFDVPRDLDQVTLHIELPENVELEGYRGQRQLVWQTSLKKGQNVLALPVTAIGEGEGRLLARIDYDDSQRQYQLVIRAQDAGAMMPAGMAADLS